MLFICSIAQYENNVILYDSNNQELQIRAMDDFCDWVFNTGLVSEHFGDGQLNFFTVHHRDLQCKLRISKSKRGWLIHNHAECIKAFWKDSHSSVFRLFDQFFVSDSVQDFFVDYYSLKSYEGVVHNGSMVVGITLSTAPEVRPVRLDDQWLYIDDIPKATCDDVVNAARNNLNDCINYLPVAIRKQVTKKLVGV